MNFIKKIATAFVSLLGTIGQTVLAVVDSAGAILLFFMRGLLAGIVPPYYPRLWLAQMAEIGFYSLPVVGLTTIFSGMVLAIQAIGSLNASLAPVAVPNLVVFAMIKELSPVLVGLMVAGRIGSAISAELGTMRVSEQIDALHTLNTNVFSYLVFPRLLAAMLMMPLLVLVGDLLGIFGGYIMAVQQAGLPSDVFLNNAWAAITFSGVFGGLIKAFAFGLIVALMGCYHGYHCGGGAEGVGIATTRAVVSSSILILIANFLITIWWYQ
ncbi:MAG: ABC transporter permease [Hydrotalea sp.]|nr:ABC transporter permease [Hydrotalea sp.]